jgi:hypothetical protein
LDYLVDRIANTIGALMLHLAATETYYQLNTFESKKWDTWPDSVKQQWDAAMNLGDAGRKTIKGNDRDYYLRRSISLVGNVLNSVFVTNSFTSGIKLVHGRRKEGSS